jgi:hypothetical protein
MHEPRRFGKILLAKLISLLPWWGFATILEMDEVGGIAVETVFRDRNPSAAVTPCPK